MIVQNHDLANDLSSSERDSHVFMGGSDVLIDIAPYAKDVIVCATHLPAAVLESATVAIAPESYLKHWM